MIMTRVITAAPAEVPPITPPRWSRRLELAFDLGAEIRLGEGRLPASAEPDAGGLGQRLKKLGLIGSIAGTRVEKLDRGRSPFFHGSRTEFAAGPSAI